MNNFTLDNFNTYKGKFLGMTHGIYCIRNLVNQKLYIGKSIDLDSREKQHFYSLHIKEHSNVYLQNAYNKYGKDNFEFIILEIVKDPNELGRREQYWEQYYKDLNVELYNIAEVTDISYRHSEETKAKIRSYRHKPDAIAKLKEAHAGKTLSEEHKNKISASHKKNPVVCLDKQTLEEIKQFESIRCAARELNTDASAIIKACKDQARSVKGYKWRYV